MGILAAAEHFQAADGNRRDERFLHARDGRRLPEVGKIAAQRLFTRIDDRADAGRAHDLAHRLRGLGIELGELVLLQGPHDDTHRLSRTDAVGRHGGAGRRSETGQTIENVDAPGCQIGRGAHRLAELAVVRHVNAAVELRTNDVGYGASQQIIQLLFMRRTGRRTCPGLTQPLGPRQTSGMRGDDPIGASHHAGGPSCSSCTLHSHTTARMRPRAAVSVDLAQVTDGLAAVAGRTCSPPDLSARMASAPNNGAKPTARNSSILLQLAAITALANNGARTWPKRPMPMAQPMPDERIAVG